MTTLRIDISGNPKSIPYRSFLDVGNNSLAILSDLDPRFSHRIEGNVEWYMNDLRLNGALTIEVYSRVRELKRKILPDVSREVAGAFIHGFDMLEHEGRSPQYFSLSGMARAVKMTQVLGQSSERAIIAQVVEQESRVEITQVSVRNLRELIPESYKGIGSVEGMLEVISIHNPRKPLFVVYESMSGKAVSCIYSGLEILHKLKESLGRRVRVQGLVSRNARSEPRKVMLYSPNDLEAFGEGRLNILPFRSLGGSDPDFTGGLSTDEFINENRG